MKKKNGLLILLIAMIILLIFVVVYVIINKNNTTDTEVIDFKKNTTSLHVINRKKHLVEENIIDKDVYQKNIITNILTDFSYNNGNVVININDNNELVINDKIVSNDLKFKTLYDKIVFNGDKEYLFLISNDNKLYNLSLTEINIDNNIFPLTELVTVGNVLNFVDINFDSDSDKTNNLIFILLDNGKIYEAFSGLRYNSKIKLLFDNILVYQDKTISNVSGYIFKDENNNEYKIKYAFMTKENNDDVILIITEDNKMFFGYVKEQLFNYYVKKMVVKDILYDNNNYMSKGLLKVYYEDDSVEEYEAICSKNYCVN